MIKYCIYTAIQSFHSHFSQHKNSKALNISRFIYHQHHPKLSQNIPNMSQPVLKSHSDFTLTIIFTKFLPFMLQTPRLFTVFCPNTIVKSPTYLLVSAPLAYLTGPIICWNFPGSKQNGKITFPHQISPNKDQHGVGITSQMKNLLKNWWIMQCKRLNFNKICQMLAWTFQ